LEVKDIEKGENFIELKLNLNQSIFSTNITLGLVKENGKFYSEEGLNITNYDFNLDKHTFKLNSVLFPMDPERQAKFID
jgi:hypothetical protein